MQLFSSATFTLCGQQVNVAKSKCGLALRKTMLASFWPLNYTIDAVGFVIYY